MSDSSRDARTYEGWISIFRTSTDFEADLVRDRLDAEGLAAVVLTQRDHSFNLNVGDLAPVHVMVRPEDEAAARQVVDAPPVSEADLTEQALAAEVMAPDAHDFAREAALDSGIDTINLGLSDEVSGEPARSRALYPEDVPDDPAADAGSPRLSGSAVARGHGPAGRPEPPRVGDV